MSIYLLYDCILSSMQQCPLDILYNILWWIYLMYNPAMENNIVLTTTMLFWISLCIFFFIMNSLWFGLLPNTSLIVAEYIVMRCYFRIRWGLQRKIRTYFSIWFISGRPIGTSFLMCSSYFIFAHLANNGILFTYICYPTNRVCHQDTLNKIFFQYCFYMQAQKSMPSTGPNFAGSVEV